MGLGDGGAGDWGARRRGLGIGCAAPRLESGLRFVARTREKKGKQGIHRRAQPSPGGIDALHRRADPQPGGVECLYHRVYPQPGGVEAVTAISFACLLHQDKYGSTPFKTNMSTSHVYNSSNKTYN